MDTDDLTEMACGASTSDEKKPGMQLVGAVLLQSASLLLHQRPNQIKEL